MPQTRDEINRDFTGFVAEAVGWGRTENYTTSDVKLKVEVPIVALNECKDKFRSITNIDNSQICAGGEKGKDSCNGDSGGGLMLETKLSSGKSRWIAVGLVSFGTPACGVENWPGVYTRIASFMDWIKQNMR